MLVAHLVPGYFAADKSQASWEPEWNKIQRTLLWVVALGSTVAPDLDVIYNALFRGFFNHSTLYTHSLFVYLGLSLLWLLLHILKRWPYLRTLVGLVAVGGLSHLLLDVVAHGTPLLYPVSTMVFSIAPKRVIEGGVWAYLTDPIFLLEPLLFGIVIVYWTQKKPVAARRKRLILVATVGGLMLFAVVFWAVLPVLQQAVLPLMASGGIAGVVVK